MRSGQPCWRHASLLPFNDRFDQPELIYMMNKLRVLLLPVLLITACCSFAQVEIPAFTGYAVPEEATDSMGESVLFSKEKGLSNWKDPNQKISYYFFVKQAGALKIALKMQQFGRGVRLQVVCGSSTFKLLPVPGPALRVVPVGTVQLSSPGFYSVELSVTGKPGPRASIQSILLEGKASEGVHFNPQPRRNAASVHLRYPLPDTVQAMSFYTELKVPPKMDPLYSYFMADGFKRGYFGMQVNSAAERRIIFSVWDAGNEAIDRNRVPDEQKVKLLAKGAGVQAGDFGNEGTGGHSHWVYNWKAGETYSFLVTALPDSASHTTCYTGYFLLPETRQWKLIACFRAPEDGESLRHLYSFVENFDGINGQLQRKAIFSNQWIRNAKGDWMPLSKASFSYDATGKAGDRIDYGGGVVDKGFYLWNGGFQKGSVEFGETFSRMVDTAKPVIDFTKNADSVAQARDDEAAIANWRKTNADSLVYSQGLYYAISKQGEGRAINVTDTVQVRYRGMLLNGEVFDQTKEKPARFPLSRLIKGWQTGLSMCRTGGKIRLVIPSAMGYGIRCRSPKIPPNSVLVFDIEVEDSKPAANG